MLTNEMMTMDACDTGIDQVTAAESLPAVWQCVDRVYCISLAERTDRQASARAQFAAAGLAQRVEFFLARRHPDNVERGILESHQACLRMGLDAGAGHIMVFEDDVIFATFNPARLQQGLAFFTHQEAAPILHLGCLVDRSRPSAHPSVRRVRYRCLSHAYVVKASLARRIAAAPWQGEAYDTLLRTITHDHLALYPSIAYQSNSPSDNTCHRTLDAVRRLLGGLRTIQWANERYHRHRRAIIAAHVAAITALLLWVLTP